MSHYQPRDEHDRYYTEEWLTLALLEALERLGLDLPGPVLEPCAGDGGIADVLAAAGHQVVEGDLLPSASRPPRYSWDFPLMMSDEGYDRPTVIDDVGSVVTNPPYKTGHYTAADFVRAALAVSPTVAMLLRATFLEEWSDRAQLLIEHPPELVVICPRATFSSPGARRKSRKAFVATWWFCWGLGIDGPTRMVRITKRDQARLEGQTELAL